MIPVKALGYRILVKQVAVEKVSEGGIIIPESRTKREQAGHDVGIVMDIGPLAWKDQRLSTGEPWVKVGDKVMFSRYAGHRFQPKSANKDEDIWWHLMNDEDIIAIVNEDIDND